MSRAITALALALVLVGACIGQTPEDKERNAVVDVGHHGPTHNPGSPCLLCHGFAMAGTVYQRATDANGESDVIVAMTDAAGHKLTALTNQAGNFYVNVDTGATQPNQGFDGQSTIPWSLVYPVHVEVTVGNVTKKMRSQIGQWGSCGECHKPDKGATSAGLVFTEVTP